MVLTSLAIISSSSSLPSNSNSDFPSASTPAGIRPLQFYSLHGSIPPMTITRASSNQGIEDGSAEQFLQNNSAVDFMRLKRGVDGGSWELQTAVVSYKNNFPQSHLRPLLQVDLVSTIHVAEKEYFQTLQKELEFYDCVLYEMVTSRKNLENKRHPSATRRLKASGTKGINIVRFILRQTAKLLLLDYQSDYLNYEADNWHHADLDYETFKLLQAKKGENFFTLARDMTLRSAKAILSSASVPEDLDSWRSKLLRVLRVLLMPFLLILRIIGSSAEVGSEASKYPEIEALSRLDFGAAVKILLAKCLTSEFFRHVVEEIEEGSVIIGDRNRAAMEALTRAIEDGHNRIAILYGGGHMPDFGRRLREDFDLFPSRVLWITAWSIKKMNLNTNSFPFLKKITRVSAWPLNGYQTLALLIFSSFLAMDLWFWEHFFGPAVN